MPSRELVIQSADDLEEIIIAAKQVVIDLRAGVDDPYARLYVLRRELGKVVATLGAGSPTGASMTALVEEYHL